MFLLHFIGPLGFTSKERRPGELKWAVEIVRKYGELECELRYELKSE